MAASRPKRRVLNQLNRHHAARHGDDARARQLNRPIGKFGTDPRGLPNSGPKQPVINRFIDQDRAETNSSRRPELSSDPRERLMRVLHVLNAAGGGASIGAIEFIKWSRRFESGIKHFVTVPGWNERHPELEDLCEGFQTVPMHWWNKLDHLPLTSRFAIWARAMQRTRWRSRTRHLLKEAMRGWGIDIVHSNSAAVLDGAVAARDLRIPHVWHIRERIGSDGFMHFHLGDAMLASTMADLSRTIVPMSRFTGDLFMRHGFEHKTEVVYDGVDLDAYQASDAPSRGQELRKRMGIARDEILIAKVASVTCHIKRHETFIEAASIASRQDSRLRFAVVGPLPKHARWPRRSSMAYFNRLKSLVHERQLDDRFQWTGLLTDAPAIMHAADFITHCCDLEGFGRIAIEAMAAGRAVIGPNVGGISESVVSGETGFSVPPDDVTAYADAMLRLAAEPALRRQFGDAGLERARSVFNPERHVDNLSRIYQQATNSAPQDQPSEAMLA